MGELSSALGHAEPQVPACSAFTNAALASIAERVDNWVSSGTGGGIGAATGEKAAAGAVGATTATLVTGNFKAMISIALQGAVVLPTPPIRRKHRHPRRAKGRPSRGTFTGSG